MLNLQAHIEEVCQRLFDQQVDVQLDIPEEQFGDYATNIAMRLAKQLGQNPREIAQKIVENLSHDTINQAEVAGPGFINITMTDQSLLESLNTSPQKSLAGQTVVAEYSDPNPFKVLHAGHLYTSVVGNSIANLLELAGAKVYRVNFGGDVGMHVAKTMYMVLQKLGGENPERLPNIANDERSEWLTSAYIEGTIAYDATTDAKTAITKLNKQIYEIHQQNDTQSPLAQIYWTTRQWSYDYFDAFYQRIGCWFDAYYPESLVAQTGLEIVKKHVGDVFTESNGAVVFDGEAHGLHTRVFINSEGLPTYEAKDVGLIYKKHEDYKFDKSLIITGNDQLQYMEVVLKAIEQISPELATATTHLTHGIVKLEGSIKMSSRKGNILRAVDVLDAATTALTKTADSDDERVSQAAVKYSFLKNKMGGDIAYNPEASVSLQGNSGPYLQYAVVRARSILHKADKQDSKIPPDVELQPDERSFVRQLSQFTTVLEQAISALAPHLICTYLFETAQHFNRFYEANRVIGDEREEFRLGLIDQYAQIIEQGLEMLGISVPERM